MIPFGKFSGKFNLHTSRKDSPYLKSRSTVKGNDNMIVINQGIAPPVQNEKRELIIGLRNQWLLSNDGITPARMAGLEWGRGEKAWVNQKLRVMGNDWTVD